MFKKIVGFFVNMATVAHEALNQPEHFEVDVVENNFDDCMRALERKAGLPWGDLSKSNREPMNMATWPLGLKIKVHLLDSKTSLEWEKEKKGYVCGRVKVPVDKLFKGDTRVLGSLNISKNCPGVFSRRESDGKSVCTSCGHVAP